MNTQVEILRIAAGGEGVGRLPDGKVVFVPRTAPGDIVAIAIVEERKRFARALPLEIVSAGAVRQEAHCAHYVADRCGACQLQHVRYQDQLRVKGTIVGDALRRVGGLAVEDPVVEVAPHEWGYRSRITLAVRGEGAERAIGFRTYDDAGRIFDLAHCPVATDAVRHVWTALSSVRDSFPRDLTQIVIRESGDTVHVVLASEAGGFDAAAIVMAVDIPCTVWLQRAGGALEAVAGTGDSPPLAFEQSHPELAQRIREAAVASLGDCNGAVVADLFCGMGTTAQLLVEAGAVVRAVDSDVEAIDWASRQTPGAMFIAARVEDCLSQLGDPAAVIVNPPRTGLPVRVRDWLKERSGGLRRIVYISCDPATLARDLKHMGCTAVKELRAYDLFPQTSHVETLVVWEP